jgi:GNAT superfamily N-acetyltransferase
VESSRIETRSATVDDVEAILATVRAGFESYKAFAPPGWRPPAESDERERTVALLADPDTWALLALSEGKPIGHLSFTPARERDVDDVAGSWRDRPPIPGMAHLWQLFVLPDWWGTGVAGRLHELGIEAMRGRGYERARLYTPAAHTRARRFYERRGWRAVDERFHPDLALHLTEYRIELRSGIQLSDTAT